MPSSFPTGLDSFVDPLPTDAMNGANPHAQQHQNANDAINAIEKNTQPVFNILAFSGSSAAADNTTALNSALTAAYNAGGGIIYYPSQNGVPYKHLSQINMPTNGATNPPLTVPIRITGDGATWNDAGGALNGATQLDFRYAGRTVTDIVTNGATTVTSNTANFTAADKGAFMVASGVFADRTVITAVGSSTSVTINKNALTNTSGQTGTIGGAKIESTGVGLLTIDNCDLINGGSDGLPILRSTYTIVKLSCGFEGTGSGTTCLTDAWVAGGINNSGGTGTPNDQFQGYGSSMIGCGFHKIRRAAVLQASCNGIQIRGNLVDATCGTALTQGAPFESWGFNTSTDVNVGNVIADNTVELTNYINAVRLTNSNQNLLSGNSGYDAGGSTLAMVRIESAAVNNLVIDGYHAGAVLAMSDANATIANTIISGLSAVTEFGPDIAFALNARVRASTASGPGGGAESGALVFTRNGTDELQFYQATGSHTMFLRDLVNARQHLQITPGASNTAANTEIASSVQIDGNIGFFATSPVTKQTSAGNTHTAAAGSTTNVFTNTTFDGGTGVTAYTVGDIVLALKNYGLLTA